MIECGCDNVVASAVENINARRSSCLIRGAIIWCPKAASVWNVIARTATLSLCFVKPQKAYDSVLPHTYLAGAYPLRSTAGEGGSNPLTPLWDGSLCVE